MYGPWDLNSLELVNGEDLGRLNRGQICHIVVSDPAPGFDIDPPLQRPPGTRSPPHADGWVRQGAPAGVSLQLLNQPASPSEAPPAGWGNVTWQASGSQLHRRGPASQASGQAEASS